METLLADLRFAWRSLVRNRTYAGVAVLTLALGIGANTAVFSVLEAVVLEPLPYDRPRDLVRVWPRQNLSRQLAGAVRERLTALSGLTATTGTAVALTGAGEPVELAGGFVLGGHFEVLGVEPMLGRGIAAADQRPGAPPVAVIGHGLWQRRFAADPAILGTEIEIDGTARTVVGVLPEGFRSLGLGWDLWLPLEIDPASDLFRDQMVLDVYGRLAPGHSLETAGAALRSVAGRLAEEEPGYVSAERAREARLVPLHDDQVGAFATNLWLLLGATALVLLIACANVANLSLARTAGRRRELAVRAALGAGRARVVRLLLAESALLALVGGGAGLLCAVWGVSALSSGLPALARSGGPIEVDGGVLAFSLLLSLASALLFGLAPALRAARSGVEPRLAAGKRGSTAGTSSHRLHQGLVLAEITLAVVLVAGAGLLAKSLHNLQRVEVGFRPENLLTLRLAPPGARYAGEEQLRTYYRQVLEAVESLPRVAAAGTINLLPMTPGGMGLGYSTPERPTAPGTPPRVTSARYVSPGFTATLGIPLLAGRRLSPHDRTGAPQAGLVNQTFARAVWGDGDPVGREVLWDDGSPWFRVAGVVGDVHQHRRDRAPRPEVYRPYEQESLVTKLFLTVRTLENPRDLVAPVRQAIWSVDGDVPIGRVGTMEEVIRESSRERRFLTALFGLFAGLALLLGAVGVYGVVSHAVSLRTREHGIRLALGAPAAALLRGALARGMAPVAAGLALGLVAASTGARLLESRLFEVEPGDPVALGLGAAVLLLAAGLASYLPARRAARVDPLVSLRAE